MATASHTSSCY